jgi:type IV pilus assembly protein PilO
MKLQAINFDFLRTVPVGQKMALLGLLLAGIGVGFYYMVVQPKAEMIESLQVEIARLDTDIQALSIKVKHLDELIAALKQLEIDLVKKKERLPPEEEAVMLLKQLSDLGVRLGLEIKLWKPGAHAEDPSKLFVKMPVNVEVSGSYHTAALFFDRINKLPRIVNVLDLKIGSPKAEQGRVVAQAVFDLVAYAAPKDMPKAGQPTTTAQK